MSEELAFTPPKDDPEYGCYEYDANVNPPGQDTLVTIYSYNSAGQTRRRNRLHSPR